MSDNCIRSYVTGGNGQLCIGILKAPSIHTISRYIPGAGYHKYSHDGLNNVGNIGSSNVNSLNNSNPF